MRFVVGFWMVFLVLTGAGATAAPWDQIQLPTCVSAGFEQAREEPELTALLNRSGASSLPSEDESRLARLKRTVEVLANRRLVYCAADRNGRFAVAGIGPADSKRFFTPRGQCAGNSAPSVFEPNCRVTVKLAAGQAQTLRVYVEARPGSARDAAGWTGFAGQLIFLDEEEGGARIASANRLSPGDARRGKQGRALTFPVAAASAAGLRRAGIWVFDPAHADDPDHAFSILVDLEFEAAKAR